MPRKTASVEPTCTGARCFNEAAARCRGKRSAAMDGGCSSGRFNEAAARCRGKPVKRTARRIEAKWLQ